MSLPLKPRVVVTGGGSGLGREICLAMARRQGRILVADVHLQRAKETVALIKEAGGEGEAFTCDVKDAEQVEALAEKADELWGGTDFLVNNAGVAGAGPVGEYPLDDWNWLLGINLQGVIHGCHFFIPRMIQQGQGAILNVASAAGFVSLPDMAAYNVSKAGVIALSETLYAELAAKNIAVTVLCPSFFKTNLLESMRSVRPLQRQLAEKAFKRSKWTAEEVAYVAIDHLERKSLYCLPQADARWQWRIKRLIPQFFMKRLPKLYQKVKESLKSYN